MFNSGGRIVRSTTGQVYLSNYILVKTSNRTIYIREYNGILGVWVSEPFCFRTNTHNIMKWCDFDMQSVINSVRQVCSALHQLPVLQFNSKFVHYRMLLLEFRKMF